jgi:16S rRNA (cytosine967-C5)-methyltransferase
MEDGKSPPAHADNGQSGDRGSKGPRPSKRSSNPGSARAPGNVATSTDQPKSQPMRRPNGFAPRAAGVRAIAGVLNEGRSLDDAMDRAYVAHYVAEMEPRDRAFMHLLVVSVLRHTGELDAVVSSFIDKALPAKSGLLWPILLCGAAQLLILDTPPHAAISLAVEQARADTGARRFDRLVNAVLRKVAVDGAARLASLDRVRLNTPDWLWERWCGTYGEETARAIAHACQHEAALDVSVKSDATGWAEKLGGIVLQTGSVRLKARGRIEDLPGYHEGEWWVQDAAAALPARLLGPVAGLTVADLCAAPGGKTAELAASGAIVTAVDVSPVRLERLHDNVARLKLAVEVVTADVATWAPGRLFDAVLLDAPCTATGTIRRHPDIMHLKRVRDVAPLAELQYLLLENAGRLVRPGGQLVYCSCSLEREEGVDVVTRFLQANPAFARKPIQATEFGGESAWISPEGDLRTLPIHLPREEPGLSGMDGFYAARLVRAVEM